MQEPRLEGLFHVTYTPGGGEYTARMIVGWKSLARYWEHSRDRWSLTGSILVSSCRWSMEVDHLHWPWSVWKLYGFWNQHDKGSDKRFVGNKEGFLLLTLVGTSKGFDNVDTGISHSSIYFKVPCRSLRSRLDWVRQWNLYQIISVICYEAVFKNFLLYNLILCQINVFHFDFIIATCDINENDNWLNKSVDLLPLPCGLTTGVNDCNFLLVYQRLETRACINQDILIYFVGFIFIPIFVSAKPIISKPNSA